MIEAESFTKDWILKHKESKEYGRINPPVLEKMINAFALLEALKAGGLDFIFKGGTSLILLLNKPNRFSVDIDICTTQSREEVEKVLKKVCEDFHFKAFELDERRSYNATIPKAITY